MRDGEVLSHSGSAHIERILTVFDIKNHLGKKYMRPSSIIKTFDLKDMRLSIVEIRTRLIEN